MIQYSRQEMEFLKRRDELIGLKATRSLSEREELILEVSNRLLDKITKKEDFDLPKELLDRLERLESDFGDVYDFADGKCEVPAHRHGNGGGWVADTATVYKNAFVGPDARVYGSARVNAGSVIDGRARVFGNAEIESSIVRDYSAVYGSTKVDCSVISDNAIVTGSSNIFERSNIGGYVKVQGNSVISGSTLDGYLQITSAKIQSAKIDDDLAITKDMISSPKRPAYHDWLFHTPLAALAEQSPGLIVMASVLRYHEYPEGEVTHARMSRNRYDDLSSLEITSPKGVKIKCATDQNTSDDWLYLSNPEKKLVFPPVYLIPRNNQ